MALFAIGDLHLSLGTNKPMDVFKGWQDYVQRLESAWREKISPEDTVVLAGDISWAMSLEGAISDFRFIDALPGEKWILKGNHDYWWNTHSKMSAFFEQNELLSLNILHNNCAEHKGAMLCASRGWMFEEGQAHDEKMRAREAQRLAHSLQCAHKKNADAEKIAFLHYPPLYPDGSFEEIINVMKQYGVKRCYYGHLHGASIRRAVQGVHDGIDYTLISADAISFSPLEIPLERRVG